MPGFEVMGLLRRRAGPPEKTASPGYKHPGPITAQLDNGLASWLKVPAINIAAVVDVVGEQHYQDALEDVADGRNAFGTRRRNVTATLVREPDNPYDTNAVRVEIAHAPVGHLSREDAPRFHAIIARLAKEGSCATCRALLTGGWDRSGGDRGLIGVKLLTGRRPAKWNGRVAFLPTGPWQEHHLVRLEVRGSGLPVDRSLVSLADAGDDVIVEQKETVLGRIRRRPDLAAYAARVRAAGLPATAQARVSSGKLLVPLSDPAAIVAALDKLGTDNLRVMRARLSPTGRWMCQRCHRLWQSKRRPPSRWYQLEDDSSNSPHICPGCGSYAFTHPY